MANFYKLNKDYINTFQTRVLNRYKSNDKRSETALLGAILDEVNELFRKLGTRTASRSDIPIETDYPDSSVYNRLVGDIGFDIDKLYNAQKMIESDINNLMNFNSVQRTKTFESFTTAQQEVYVAYVKSKRDTIGGVEVPGQNPFTSSDNMSTESKDVYIDQSRKVLTLGFSPQVKKNIDVNNTVIYKIDPPQSISYPNSDTLGIGSHWKKSTTDSHFIDTDSISEVQLYKTMMIDDPTNNIGVGLCEFETVKTASIGLTKLQSSNKNLSRSVLQSTAIVDLKEWIGQRYGKDPYFIYMDLTNSLQGMYVDSSVSRPTIGVASKTQYKLVVPFTSDVLTNEIIVDFSATSDGYYPKINWGESKVFSKIGGSDIAYALIPPKEDNEIIIDGKHVCHTTTFIYPSRMELILEYESTENVWSKIDFYMSHYVYSDEKKYDLAVYGNDTKSSIILKKSYDIFVDTEGNQVKEKDRALNVLRSPNRSSI